MPLSRVESVQTTDGPFDLTVWLPDAATGPGLPCQRRSSAGRPGGEGGQ
jgi:hypothetical protein